MEGAGPGCDSAEGARCHGGQCPAPPCQRPLRVALLDCAIAAGLRADRRGARRGIGKDGGGVVPKAFAPCPRHSLQPDAHRELLSRKNRRGRGNESTRRVCGGLGAARGRFSLLLARRRSSAVCGHRAWPVWPQAPQARRRGRGFELRSRALPPPLRGFMGSQCSGRALADPRVHVAERVPSGRGADRSPCPERGTGESLPPAGRAATWGGEGLPVTWGVLGRLRDPLPERLLARAAHRAGKLDCVPACPSLRMPAL